MRENIKAGNRMAGNNRLIHTPEGVKDSYNGECRKKLAVQDKILDTFYLYGYEHIPVSYTHLTLQKIPHRPRPLRL